MFQLASLPRWRELKIAVTISLKSVAPRLTHADDDSRVVLVSQVFLSPFLNSPSTFHSLPRKTQKYSIFSFPLSQYSSGLHRIMLDENLPSRASDPQSS